MSKIFISAVVFLLFVACSNPAKDKKQTARLINEVLLSNDSISISYNSKAISHFYYSQKIGGEFFNIKDSQIIKIASKDPVFFIEATSKQIPFVLYPGDSVLIEKIGDSSRLKSENPLRQNELNFFRDLVYTHGPIRNVLKSSYIIGKVNLKQRDSLIQKKYNERLIFLEDYKKKYPVRDEFLNYCQDAFKSAKLNEQLCMDYRGFNKDELLKFYQDSFSVFKSFLNDSSLLHQTLFRDALHNYARYYISEHTTKNWLFLEGLELQQLLSLWDSVSVNFKGESKAYLEAEIVKMLSHEQYSYSNLKKLVNEIKYRQYAAYLSGMIEENYPGVSPKTLFEQVLYNGKGDSLTFAQILPKDTLVVLDFWASWCVPCIEEFSYTASVEQKLIGRPVKFIRLSTDEHQKDWQEAAGRYKITADSYRIKGASNSKIISEWKINSIPRFIIIKNNRALDSNAPRPSDGNKLFNQLSSLLK